MNDPGILRQKDAYQRLLQDVLLAQWVIREQGVLRSVMRDGFTECCPLTVAAEASCRDFEYHGVLRYGFSINETHLIASASDHAEHHWVMRNPIIRAVRADLMRAARLD